MRRDPIFSAAVRTVLFFPAGFVVWLALGTLWARPVAWCSWVLADWLQPVRIAGMEFNGSVVTFATKAVIRADGGQLAVLLPEVNVQTYTYGVVLLVALSLAARAPLKRLLLGMALLLPFHVWSTTFDLLLQLGTLGGGLANSQTSLLAPAAVGLGYQLGCLILPVLAPTMLWAATNREFFDRLSGGEPARSGLLPS